MSLDDGRPVSIAEMTQGREVALFVIDRSLLPLSTSTADRFALEEVEQIMGVSLVGQGSPETVAMSPLPPGPGPGRGRPREAVRRTGTRRPRAGRAASFRASTGAGREWVAGKMEEAGFASRMDAAANLIGTLPGAAGLSGAIVTGSHTDTVQGGGRYDGIIGVLGAIEAVRCLRSSGAELDHDLVVVDFLGEEPNDFGLSCVGSRAVAGAARRGSPGPSRRRADATSPRR